MTLSAAIIVEELGLVKMKSWYGGIFVHASLGWTYRRMRYESVAVGEDEEAKNAAIEGDREAHPHSESKAPSSYRSIFAGPP